MSLEGFQASKRLALETEGWSNLTGQKAQFPWQLELRSLAKKSLGGTAAPETAASFTEAQCWPYGCFQGLWGFSQHPASPPASAAGTQGTA